MKKPLVVTVLVLVTTLTACGGSDGSKAAAKEEQEIAATLAKSFVATGPGAGTNSPLDGSQAKCFAGDFVDAAGVKKLKSSKLIDENGDLGQTDVKFDESLAHDFASAYLKCVDFQAEQAEAIAAADPRIDAKAVEECLNERMPNRAVEEMIVASYTSSDADALLAASQKIEACKEGAKP